MLAGMKVNCPACNAEIGSESSYFCWNCGKIIGSPDTSGKASSMENEPDTTDRSNNEMKKEDIENLKMVDDDANLNSDDEKYLNAMVEHLIQADAERRLEGPSDLGKIWNDFLNGTLSSEKPSSRDEHQPVTSTPENQLEEVSELPKQEEERCRACGTISPFNAKFCKKCGTPLKETEASIYCWNCGISLPATSKYCKRCGSKLHL